MKTLKFHYYSEEDNEEDNDEDNNENNNEDNEEAKINAELNDDEYETDEDDIEIPDFGYPDMSEAQELLKKIENLHFNNDKGYNSGILAEAYYQMIMEVLH